ncbi:MAG: hypothetical protein KJ645_09625, partial [Planctomycetes bacterium]|nr:hypothetical protein [Planctomycetota bacterium]
MPDGALNGRGMYHGFRGVELAASRSPVVQKALTIDWMYPVYIPEKRASNGTESPQIRRALGLNEVYDILAKGDQRPLLILREFDAFDDPGNEKLSQKLYTEETVLLSHWFNCVRLPPHVVESDHPFHNLFPGEKPHQLLFSSTNGATVKPFDYQTSKADLEKLMIEVLKEYYTENPSKKLDELLKVLKELDRLDGRMQNLKESLDRVVEARNPNPSKIKKLKKELKEAEEAYE